MNRASLLLGVMFFSITAQTLFSNDENESAKLRLRGEYERQEGLLVGGEELLLDYPEVLKSLARGTRGQVRLVIMVNKQEQEREIRLLLSDDGIPAKHVRFVDIRHDTIWVRDYGPRIMESSRGAIRVIDPKYDGIGRPLDEVVPEIFSRKAGVPLVQTSIGLDGGNLVSNGRGIFLTTTYLYDGNSLGGTERRDVDQFLRHSLGARTIVELEALDGELTGHVDMFAAFVSADTVIVGKYDSRIDPINAAILDRNAALLASRRLRVVRIPMPDNSDGVFRTYTNLAFANGAVFVPVYPAQDRRTEDRALQILRGLMPSRRIIAVDCGRLAESGGTLHCITMNLPTLPSGVLKRDRRIDPARNQVAVEPSCSLR